MTLTYGRWEFADYLTRTLIPDLRRSGDKFTADDFTDCVRFMRNKGVSEKAYEHARYLTGTLIPDLIESGKTSTATDFKFAVAFMLDPESMRLTIIED